MKSTAAFLAVLAVLTFSPNFAHSCSCAPSTAEEQLEMSDIVVAGRVISVETFINRNGNEVHRALVQVHEVWKGDLTPRLLVDTTPIASCEFTLFDGQEYLIYAKRNVGEETTFFTNDCMRTRLRQHAQDDIKELGDSITLDTVPSTWGMIKALFSSS